MTTKRTELKVGDMVKLKDGVVHKCPQGRENNRTARLAADVSKNFKADGAWMMDRDLRGCKFWNEEDLDKVE